jgi:hypothetical protein
MIVGLGTKNSPLQHPFEAAMMLISASITSSAL